MSSTHYCTSTYNSEPTFRGMQGVPFRAAYGKIGQLHSFVLCPHLCLTATAGKETRTEIMKALHMRDTKLIKISPDKPNCKFVVKKCPGEVEDELMWVLTELKENKSSFSRTIIYCRSLSSFGQLYWFFKQELDGSLSGMYAMYHSSKISAFPGPYSTLKCPLCRSLLLNSTKLCMQLLASRVQDIIQPLQMHHSKPFALILRHTGYWPKK